MNLFSQLKIALSGYTPVDESKIYGCDTSHWTGIVNWNIAKDRGMTFTIGKAMDGINKTSFFVENYEGAKKAGIYTGMYSWLYKNTYVSTTAQAKAYADMYKNYPTDLPPTIDFEWSAGGNPTADVDLYNFLARFEDITGVRCMVYTAPGYWIPYGSTKPYYKNFPLWIAQYKINKPDSLSPWGTDYKIWQFTDRADGRRYGYPAGGEAMADMNYFNGTKEDFLNFVGHGGIIVPPVEPPVVPTNPNEVTVLMSAVNVRSGPSTSYPVVGGLYYGNKVIISEYKKEGNNIWGKFDRGWFALLYGGIYYTDKTDFSSITEQPKPPTLPEENLNKVAIFKTNMNIRNVPLIKGTIVGVKPSNVPTVITKMTNDNLGNIWGQCQEGWIALKYNGQQMSNLTV